MCKSYNVNSQQETFLCIIEHMHNIGSRVHVIECNIFKQDVDSIGPCSFLVRIAKIDTNLRWLLDRQRDVVRNNCCCCCKGGRSHESVVAQSPVGEP